MWAKTVPMWNARSARVSCSGETLPLSRRKFVYVETSSAEVNLRKKLFYAKCIKLDKEGHKDLWNHAQPCNASYCVAPHNPSLATILQWLKRASIWWTGPPGKKLGKTKSGTEENKINRRRWVTRWALKKRPLKWCSVHERDPFDLPCEYTQLIQKGGCAEAREAWPLSSLKIYFAPRRKYEGFCVMRDIALILISVE